jgi:probable rRNA maturation factor
MQTRKSSGGQKLTIDIQFATPAIETAISNTASPALIKKWVKSSTPLGGLLTLRFVNASEGKNLNHAFRKKAYATNVLTFPYQSNQDAVMADLIFCLPVIQKEAKAQDKSVKAHLAHLIVHGCLHAQGYDHMHAGEAKKMERLEIQLLQQLGFPNPY